MCSFDMYIGTVELKPRTQVPSCFGLYSKDCPSPVACPSALACAQKEANRDAWDRPFKPYGPSTMEGD